MLDVAFALHFKFLIVVEMLIVKAFAEVHDNIPLIGNSYHLAVYIIFVELHYSCNNIEVFCRC